MRTLPFVLVLCALAALLPPHLNAQETQVALDQSGEIEEIDRRLATRLGLFLDEYPQLQVVRLYQVTGGAYVLEVTYTQEGRTARQRVDMTGDEVRALRARVTDALSRNAPEVVLDQDGRFLLVATTTVLGTGFYGWAAPVILGLDSGRGILATYMLTAGASFALPYLYTRTRPVTYGMANAGFWGATRGIGHGLALAALIYGEPDNDEFDPYVESGPDSEERVTMALGLVASLGEGLAGYSWARNVDMSAGEAHTVGNFGDFGTSWATSSMLILQPEGVRVAAAARLAGAATGLFFGTRRAPALPYTWGDAEVQRAGFFLGMYNGFVVSDWIIGDGGSDNDLRILGALFMAGSGAGVYMADRVLVGRDFSVGQSLLIDFGTIAGGLLGMGVGVLLGPDDLEDPTLFFTLGAAGANAGFLLTLGSLADDAERRNEDRLGALDFQFNPGALMRLHPSASSLASTTGIPTPLFSLNYRF